MEMVDVLMPPTFAKSGVVKPRNEAITNGDWIGTFNLWIISTDPVPAIIYQQRSSISSWAPDKLDVTVGGHYASGETLYDGLREAEEELGKHYNQDDLTYLGRKLHVSPDTRGFTRHNVVDIFFTTDNSALETYTLEKNEVYAIVECPIDELIKVHSKNSTFRAVGLTNERQQFEIEVNQNSFPYNWDNYHFKIALLADRYVKGEKQLLY